MGILRAIGYVFAIIILIGGILLFPIGLVLIIPAIIMIWMLHKGGQVTQIKKDLKAIKQIEEENQKLKLDQMKRNAMKDGWEDVK